MKKKKQQQAIHCSSFLRLCPLLFLYSSSSSLQISSFSSSSSSYKVAFVNSNSATIMTDPKVANRTYMGLVIPLLEQIIAVEHLDVLPPAMAGKTVHNLVVALSPASLISTMSSSSKSSFMWSSKQDGIFGLEVVFGEDPCILIRNWWSEFFGWCIHWMLVLGLMVMICTGDGVWRWSYV